MQLIADTLRESGHKPLADGLVQEWLDRIAVLGFHTAELDIREESGRLSGAVQELAAELGLCIDFRGLREDRKQAFLLDRAAPRRRAPAHARAAQPRGPRDARSVPPAGPHVGPLRHAAAGGLDREHDPSCQRRADDALAQPAGAACENVAHVPLPIMPLLETIDDLRRAEGILRDMFAPAGLPGLSRCVWAGTRSA